MKSTSSRIIIIGLILVAAGFVINTQAQSALDGFDPNANNSVRIVLRQPDGKILIAGDFTSLAPNGGPSVTRNRIARLNPDGSLDTVFNPNSNSSINALALQADGKILVSGTFSIIGGQSRGFFARLDAVTGLADPFNPTFDGQIHAMAVQMDGKILVGGDFTSIDGVTRNKIARIDAVTGQADSFDPNTNIGGPILKILVQPDGKILAGGLFSSIGGQARNSVARLDPVTGLADSFNPNVNSLVWDIALQADGNVVIGGVFTTVGGQTRNRIARCNSVNGLPDSFNPNANSDVNVLRVQPDGNILAGGAFTSIGGQTRNRIARLSPITGLAVTFNPNAGNAVSAITLQPDGKILIGGSFTTLTPTGGTAVTRNRIARLESNGIADRTLTISPDGPVYAIAFQSDGKFLIGGSFFGKIARINADGTPDPTFIPNLIGYVNSIAVLPDGKIVIGGNFSVVGGQVRNHLARLNAATGAPDSWNPDADGEVESILVQADGKILVGGSFANIGGQPRSRIARLDADTGLADGFNPQANGIVYALAVLQDGKVVAGGSFTSVSGTLHNRIARLDAVTGTADSWNPNLSGGTSVYALLVQPDGKVLVGGSFTNLGGQPRRCLARLDPVTAAADSFDPNASFEVGTLALQADGKVFAGGRFSTIGGQTRNGIARLDPITGLADSWNANSTEFVDSLAIQPDGKVITGGFANNNIGGQSRTGLARLTNDTNATQDLTVAQTFVTWFRSGSSPQFSRVTFEDSTDGVNFNFLGNGTPSGSNWTLTGLNLSQQSLYIRARGFYTGGKFTNSGSMQEFVRNAVPAPAVSGTVTYGNAIGAPTPRFVSNVLITASGSPTLSTTTDGLGVTAGQYRLTGFGSNSYTVTPTKTGGVNGINSFDAARVAQHVAGTGPGPFATNEQRISADVTNNGVINSFDAAKIAQYAAGLPLVAPNLSGTWRFFVPNPTFPLGASQTTRTYASITSSIVGDDYIGILGGEVTGNWTPSAARPARTSEIGQ